MVNAPGLLTGGGGGVCVWGGGGHLRCHLHLFTVYVQLNASSTLGELCVGAGNSIRVLSVGRKIQADSPGS